MVKKTTPATLTFDKEMFKKNVMYSVKTLYRKTLEEATPQQIFQAVAYTVKDTIIDNWLETQQEYEKKDPKTVYYLSMEFLMGRALGNDLINLQEYKPVKEALEELGLDLNVIEDQEPDAALGNGGLGRLAACFLDSLATLGYAAYGCGIRYRYGMFKQEIRDGYQVEVPDNWLKDGNPFELRRPEYAKEVKFGGYVKTEWDGLTPALLSGNIDVIIAGMSPTAERRMTIDFTDSYYDTELTVVVRKDSAFASAKSLADLAGAKITGQMSTFHYDMIDQIEGAVKMPAMETFPTMIVAVSSGAIDGYVADRPGAVSATSANPDLTYVTFDEGQGFTVSPDDAQIAVGVRQGSELKEQINEILAGISAEERNNIMDAVVLAQPLSE